MNPDSRTRQDNLKYIDFPSIEDVSIDSIDQERSLDRQAYTQQTLVEGDNRQININDGDITYVRINKDGFLLSDGQTNRIIMGKQENGF